MIVWSLDHESRCCQICITGHTSVACLQPAVTKFSSMDIPAPAVYVVVAAAVEARSKPSSHPAALHWNRPADITSGASAVGAVTFKFQSDHHIPVQSKIAFRLPYLYLNSVASCSFGAGSSAQGACALTHVDLTHTNLVCTTSTAAVSAGVVELILPGGSFAAGAYRLDSCNVFL